MLVLWNVGTKIVWYVAQVVKGTEDSAVEKCRVAISTQVASKIFTPKCQKLKKFAGVWQIVTDVLFSGYVFIESRVSSNILLEQLKRISGTVTPVQIGGGFYPIREDEELFLRALMDEHGCIPFSIGHMIDGKLIIDDGPLDGKTEWIRRIDRHRRIAEVEVLLWKQVRRMKVGLEVTSKEAG